MNKILLVEDEDHLRHLVASYLRKENFTVIEAADGQEALDRFAEDEFCLLILDLMMPGMDGLAAAREIRAGRSESRRREQAISDLLRAKADVQQAPPAQQKTEPEPPFLSKDGDAQETKAETDSAAAPHRRRRQSGLQLIRSEQAK